MGYQTCKFCKTNMMSQGVDTYSNTIYLECFVCPKCGAVYDHFMTRKYVTLSEKSEWYKPENQD
jgi:hypothetical protein